jgi:hypothetical protein
MANYKPDISCQNKFIPVNFSEQILPGTFEYALCYIVENKLDLSGFDAWYNNDKTTSKGTIQGYNGIAINDDKHQITLQAQTWGSVGEQQTLQPAIEQVNQQLDKLNAAKIDNKKGETTTRFTADRGFNSEDNLAFMANSGFDTYIADTQFRSRNPLFKESETYHTEKETRRLKIRNGKPRLFTSQDFHYDKHNQTCRCPAGNLMWCSGINVKSNNKAYMRFGGYLKDCKAAHCKSIACASPRLKEGDKYSS